MVLLPKPNAQSKMKRKPGLNSKATGLADDTVLAAIKEKEAERVRKEVDDCDKSDHKRDAGCPICGLTFLEDDSHSAWVCCDGCQTWMDFKSTGLKNPK